VEQPELHVHPRLQTELGDLFAAGLTPVGEQHALFDDILGELIPNGRTFLIETHSEHLVLRLLRRIRERTDDELEQESPSVSPELLSVNYLQPSTEGAQLYHLRVDQNGEFIDSWPEGFFAERRKELF
jgi:predicted ATPase